MAIRQKSPAEISEQFLSLPPESVNLSNGSDVSDSVRYRLAQEGYLGSMMLNRSDPQIAETALFRAMDILQSGPTNLFLKRSSGKGIPAALNRLRQKQDSDFSSTIDTLGRDNEVDEEIYEQNRKTLAENTLRLDQEPDDKKKKMLFPSGNWLLHSADTETIVKILANGRIRSTASLVNEDPENLKSSKGGSFGVSWNMNSVVVLLGSARHLAGFMADPSTVLAKQSGILAIPQKSTFNEVQYFFSEPDDIYGIRDAENLYDISNFLFNDYGALVAWLSGMSGVKQYTGGNQQVAYEYMERVEQLGTMLASGKYEPDFLRKHYIINKANGGIRFSSIVGKLSPNEINLVFLQSVADGAFGQDLSKLIDGKLPKKIESSWVRGLQPAFDKLIKDTDKTMAELTETVGKDSNVDIENTVFYCSAKDYDKWIDAIARLPKIPLGVVVYSDPEIRVQSGFVDGALENNGKRKLQTALSTLNHGENVKDWDNFFPNGRPKTNSNSHYTVDRVEAAQAGVMALDINGRLEIKSLNDIDDED